MTDKEWKQVEQRLTPPIGYVRLNIDGYTVTIVTVEEKPLHYCLGVYVNGEIRVEWVDQDCEVRRKFYRRRTRSLLDAKGRQMLKKERKSVREAVLKKCTYEDYTPYWGSFKSLKSHLIKHCTLIELRIRRHKMIHEVKCCPEYFADLWSGIKTFEVRKKDRPYQTGDILAVNEFAPFEYEFSSDEMRERFSRTVNGVGRYSGDCLMFKITYILDDPQYCKDGMVILGLARCEI